MKVKFIGRDPAKGLQIEGVTYFPGEVGDVSEMWSRVLILSGEAVAYRPPLAGEERVADVVVEHRDTPAKRRKR
jgi:hypothetical protein